MTALHIPKPCHEDWTAMTPQERGRHCAVCDKTVVDLTKMRPVEGRRFLGRLRDDLSAGAHVCVRAHADAAGRLLAPSATRRLLTNGLAAVLAVAVAGCQGNGPAVGQSQQPTTHQQPVQQQAQPQPVTMGEPVAKEPPACIQGDVAVAPQPQVELGRVVAAPTPPEQGLVKPVVVPTPQPLMGSPKPQPQVRELKGEVSATPRETTGKHEAVDR